MDSYREKRKKSFAFFQISERDECLSVSNGQICEQIEQTIIFQRI